jgi:hypothetical protein
MIDVFAIPEFPPHSMMGVLQKLCALPTPPWMRGLPSGLESIAQASIAPRRAVPRTVDIDLSALDRDQRKALAEALLASIGEEPAAPAAG